MVGVRQVISHLVAWRRLGAVGAGLRHLVKSSGFETSGGNHGSGKGNAGFRQGMKKVKGFVCEEPHFVYKCPLILQERDEN